VDARKPVHRSSNRPWFRGWRPCGGLSLRGLWLYVERVRDKPRPARRCVAALLLLGLVLVAHGLAWTARNRDDSGTAAAVRAAVVRVPAYRHPPDAPHLDALAPSGIVLPEPAVTFPARAKVLHASRPPARIPGLLPPSRAPPVPA
jgi:hypothetical protein